MSYKLNDQEFEAVVTLDAVKRYSHFIKRVADWQELWSAKAEDGWMMLSDDDGNNCIPVWPHERYAAAFLKDDKEYQAQPITCQDWLEKWLPNLESDNSKVAVFPNLTSKGVVVPAKRLNDDLRFELTQYE